MGEKEIKQDEIEIVDEIKEKPVSKRKNHNLGFLDNLIFQIKKGLKNKEVVIFLVIVIILFIFIQSLPKIFEFLN